MLCTDTHKYHLLYFIVYTQMATCTHLEGGTCRLALPELHFSDEFHAPGMPNLNPKIISTFNQSSRDITANDAQHQNWLQVF